MAFAWEENNQNMMNNDFCQEVSIISQMASFFRKFYPSTTLYERTFYKQWSDPWRNDIMGNKTICQVGCLISSVSMALNSRNLTIDGQDSNPGTLNAWLRTHSVIKNIN